MEIREFSEIIRGELEKRTGYEVEFKEVTKNNGTVMHGICITEPGCSVTPTLYMESFHDAYENGLCLEDIVEKILHVHQKEKPSASFDVSWFTGWERVKGNVAFRLINYDENKKLLEKIPHTKYLDLAKVYFVVVEQNGIRSGSILIHNVHMGIWGVTTEQLEEIAAENTPKQYPVQFNSIGEALEELNPFECDLSELELDEWPMYIISNNKRIYGASVLCYPNAIKEVAERMKSNLYILPSSIHELILVLPSANLDEEHLKNMVHDVNRELVAAEEVLSDSVYYYSRKEDSIKII